jgi:phosphomevalonate kinase
LIASAPGKLVLSGAYVVLDGAPAVVTAVSRRATADASRRAEFLSPELRAAFGDGAPFVDSSPMRKDGRKLGLGSSAAVLVAALGARTRALGLPLDETTRALIADEAYMAHRFAQGGGSGVDILAATHGGTLLCRADPPRPPRWERIRLPPGLLLEAWICPESASTSALLEPIRALRRDAPPRYAALTAPAAAGAAAVEQALRQGDPRLLREGLLAQAEAMLVLGDATSVPIFPPYLRALFEHRPPRSVVAQAGAGGGDIALFWGEDPSPPAWREEARMAGLELLPLSVEAEGLRAEDTAP